MVVDIRGRRDGSERVLACASHAGPCLCCDEVRTGQMG